MPPTFKATIGLCGVGALAVGAGVVTPQPFLWFKSVIGVTPASCQRPGAAARPRDVIPVRGSATAPPAWSSVSVARPLAAVRAPERAGGGRVQSGAPQPAASRTRVAAFGAQAYSAMVQRIARRYAVEWKLVMAIIASESGGDPTAVSPAGAVGLMQLMPETAAHLGVDPWDPEQNVEGAVRYLSTLISTFGSVDLSLVADNAETEFAQRYREGAVELGAETRAFLIRVGAMVN